MARNQLKVVGVQIRQPTANELAAGGVQAWLDISVEVENQARSPLHVWTSHRGYDYDPQSKVLTIQLAERPPSLPPGLVMISDHPPRTPEQIELKPKERAKIRVRFPAHVRRAAPREEGAGGWIEDPIGEIAHVDVNVQHATQPVEGLRKNETAADFRTRLLAHGEVVRARITPASGRSAN